MTARDDGGNVVPVSGTAGRRRGSPWRNGVLAVIAVMALLSAACGEKESARQAALESESDASAQAVDPEDGPGVTADEIKIGFIVLDLERLSEALDLDFGESGDYFSQIQALTDAVNARGGIAGRTMVPVIHEVDAFLDSAPREEATCKQFTQDDEVFAVVLVGQFQPNARPCYAGAETLMLDTTAFALDQQGFDKFAPYLYQPSYPEYGALLDGLISGLDEGDFFEDATVAVMGMDINENHRVFEEKVLPALEERGVEPADVRWIDPANSQTLQAGQDQAVLSFKSKGVDRIIVVGGQRLAAFMMNTSKGQSFEPRYAMTTWDNPEFNIRNYPTAMAGAIGVSALPGYDAVSEDDVPFPREGAEQTCIDTLLTVGDTGLKTRNEARQSELYCDAMDLLFLGFEGHTGPVNADAFAANVGALGDRYEASATYKSFFGPGLFAGANGYVTVAYDPDCDCMAPIGDVQTLNQG
jgi:hypothetical protein